MFLFSFIYLFIDGTGVPKVITFILGCIGYRKFYDVQRNFIFL